MSNKINWSTHVQVPGGPQVVMSSVLDVTAYEVIDVVIQKTKDLTVSIGAAGTDINFLLIQSDRYGAALTYEVGAATYKLEGPHMLIGPGATQILASGATAIKFINNLVYAGTEPVNIKILVGRVPTP